MKTAKDIYKYLKYRKINCFYFVSFPKSGRTWVRQFLNNYYFIKYPFSITDRSINSYNHEIPNINYSHSGYDYFSQKDISYFSKKYIKDKNKKVVFMVRDPRDVFVSYFFQLTQRFDLAREKRKMNWDNIKISELLYNEDYGLNHIIDFMNIWYNNLNESNNVFHLIQYEEIKKNQIVEFTKLLEFISSEPINDAALNEAIQLSSFKKMKKNEQKKIHNLDQLNSLTDNENSSKVRKGIVGDYVNYFSENDVKYINLQMDRLDRELKSLFI